MPIPLHPAGAELPWATAAFLAYAATMIRMVTFDELKRQNHTLGLYCVRCERWGDADLDALIRRGLGGRRITRTRFRCRRCGEVVEKQIRPPVPEVGAAAAYI